MRLTRMSGVIAAISLLGIFSTSPAQAQTLLTLAGNGNAFRLDLVTGTVTDLGPSGMADAWGMAQSPTGELYAIESGGGLWRIDPTTGDGTFVVNVPAGNPQYNALAFSPDGTLYAIEDNGNESLFRIDLSGGKTFIASLGTNAHSLEFTPDGTLYTYGNLTTPSHGLMTIDPATGARSDVNPSLGAQVTIHGLASAADGTLYGAGFDDVFVIDRTTGALTRVGGFGPVQIGGLAVVDAPPPADLCAQIGALIASVESAGLHDGTDRALRASLRAAAVDLCDVDPTNDSDARGPLEAFLHKVAAQRGKKIDPALADSISAATQAILAQLP